MYLQDQLLQRNLDALFEKKNGRLNIHLEILTQKLHMVLMYKRKNFRNHI